MIGQRWVVAVGVVVLSGCGGSELRRALNDIIDQRESDAAELSEIYESFEAELAAELMAGWGATPDGGCPELENQTGLSTVWRNDRNRDERMQARQAAWVRNVPGEQCRCLQKTIVGVQRVRDRVRLDPSRFEEERAQLAEMTEEELPLAAQMIRGSADQFSPDGVLERVAGWKLRRYGENEEPGWQSAAEQVDRAFDNLGMRTRIFFGSCDRF